MALVTPDPSESAASDRRASRPRTARERARAEIRGELLAAARRHLASDGAAALSLRAVARDLGVASSAVYRYVESRDALLTLLIVEAYDAVGRACETALNDAVARGADAGSAWLAVARAFRAWAHDHPHEYALVYGTPVPGYAAPVETVGPAVRLWGVVARVLVAARAEGRLNPPRGLDAAGLLDPGVVAFAAGVARGAPTHDAYAAAVGARATPDPEADLPARAADVARSVTLFAALVGAVSAELFGHLHNLAADPARLFDVTTATAALGVGLDVPLDGPHDVPPDGPSRSGDPAAR